MISITMEEAFQNIEVEQIHLGVITDNEQAILLYEKLGFQTYGIQKEFLKLEDAYLDKRLMIKYKEK